VYERWIPDYAPEYGFDVVTMSDAFVRQHMPFNSSVAGDAHSGERDINDVVLGRDNMFYRHNNPPADGRCSIHAAGDIIGLSIDETVVAFEEFVTERCARADEHLQFTADHPDICAYFESQRRTSADYQPDDHLLRRYRTGLTDEVGAHRELLDNIHQLHRDGRWRGSQSSSMVSDADNYSDRIGGLNTAAMGSGSFDSFIEHYYMKMEKKKVKAVSIKVPSFSADRGRVSKSTVQKFLEYSNHDLRSGPVWEHFRRDRLVVFLEVGEGHFHTLVPEGLRAEPGDDSLQLQRVGGSRKRSSPDPFMEQVNPLPAAKKLRPATSSQSDQAAELSLLRPAKIKVTNVAVFTFSFRHFVLFYPKVSHA
jgi:hypothetical protein